MAELVLNREYRLKFYLNARHYIIIKGEKGETHPHTWEFALRIKFGKGEFVEFTTFEREIEAYLSKYQNQVMNEIEPFGVIVPTLENMADYFTKDFYEIIQDMGGRLVRVEASETPTRSYILNLETDNEFTGISVGSSKNRMNEIINAVLDEAEI